MQRVMRSGISCKSWTELHGLAFAADRFDAVRAAPSNAPAGAKEISSKQVVPTTFIVSTAAQGPSFEDLVNAVLATLQAIELCQYYAQAQAILSVVRFNDRVDKLRPMTTTTNCGPWLLQPPMATTTDCAATTNLLSATMALTTITTYRQLCLFCARSAQCMSLHMLAATLGELPLAVNSACLATDKDRLRQCQSHTVVPSLQATILATMTHTLASQLNLQLATTILSGASHAFALG